MNVKMMLQSFSGMYELFINQCVNVTYGEDLNQPQDISKCILSLSGFLSCRTELTWNRKIPGREKLMSFRVNLNFITGKLHCYSGKSK